MTFDKNRVIVWIALSDLYLDTDPTLFYDKISDKCILSGYSLEEIKFILLNEVGPALSMNFYSIAGEWSGFDEDWLVNVIEKRRRGNVGIKKVFRKLFTDCYIRRYSLKHWDSIEKIISIKLNKIISQNNIN